MKNIFFEIRLPLPGISDAIIMISLGSVKTTKIKKQRKFLLKTLINSMFAVYKYSFNIL